MSWVAVLRRVARPFDGPRPERRDSVRVRIRARFERPSKTIATIGDRVGWIKFSQRLERETVNYSNTVDNVLKTLMTRVYVDAPEWNPHPCFDRILKKAAHRLGKQMGDPLNEDGLRDALAKFPPAKRERYSKALEDTLDLKKASKVTTFIKDENVPLKPKDKPRVIQFRQPAFLAHLMKTIKPIEHAMYHNRYLFNKYQKLTCAKGMDILQKMQVLQDCVADLGDCLAIPLDGSAFDAHVCKDALRAEWRFYRIAMESAGWPLADIQKTVRMGKEVLTNKCTASVRDGVVGYTVEGNRMSGDLTTGLGNVVLMCLYTTAVMKELGVPERAWRFLDDGDDLVLFVAARYRHLVTEQAVSAAYARYSQEVTFEGEPTLVTSDSLEAIEFCQMSPVRVAGIWRLIRNPYKVYNGYKMVSKWYRDPVSCQKFWATISHPEMIYAAGVPIHRDLFHMFHRLAEDKKPIEMVQRRFWLKACERVKMRMPEDCEPDHETRLSYEKAFGIAPSEQISIEEELRAWRIDHLPGEWHLVL